MSRKRTRSAASPAAVEDESRAIRPPPEDDDDDDDQAGHAESMLGTFAPRRAATEKRMTNRQKCLVLGGRGMSSKDRHLLLDLRGLMPHARAHAKIGRTHALGDTLVELSGLHQCNGVLFLEPHRGDIRYLWLAQAPRGPSLRFQLTNAHTADGIRMAGNCLKFSRALLHFDHAFETEPALRVAKALLHMAFNTPRYHPLSKPFVDRIIAFFWLDRHIWVRHYQIVPTEPPSLLEIGPRFTLAPEAILDGCGGGRVLWKSATARPPTAQRRDRQRRRLERREANEGLRERSERHRAQHPPPAVDPLDVVFRG